MTRIEPPLAMLAELTHRCPLQCPYCSNPMALEKAGRELDTETWCRVLTEASELGVLQVHFSGGEPTVRRDLEVLVRHAAEQDLYVNLISAAVTLGAERLAGLRDAGLAHVQISMQGAEAAAADRIAGYPGAYGKKLDAARLVLEAGLALTVNAVVHRQNLDQLPAMIDLAVAMGARRLEVAHVQYYGWALRNRASLMPTRAQIDRSSEIVEAARERLKGTLTIDYVTPDYYARRPKACMNGWGRRFLNVTPSGHVLPCHAAETIPELTFDSVRERSLSEIWEHSDAFMRFRGTGWMPEPCASCERREIDWGGCRCQALALTGDAGATDPACALSPHHQKILELAQDEAAAGSSDFVYRNFRNAT